MEQPTASEPLASSACLAKSLRFKRILVGCRKAGRRSAFGLLRVQAKLHQFRRMRPPPESRDSSSAAQPQGVAREPMVRMLLRSPQIWWAFLGLRSNSALTRLMQTAAPVILFDDPVRLPQNSPANTRYFLVCWDGLIDQQPIEDARRALPPDADLIVLVVGDFSSVSNEPAPILRLYPDGELQYRERPRFDLRSAARILFAKIRSVVTPLKNLMQRGSRLQTLRLLFGSPQIVFCGSIGMTPPLIDMLCRRYSVDPALFAGHRFFSTQQSPEDGATSLAVDGPFLADLYDRGQIGQLFFLSVIHLLGREYFVARIRHAGLPLYVNRFAEGSYIDVYSTPFYKQHVFLDFGSVVGSGNYPRIADLTWFGKTFLRIDLEGRLDRLLPLARSAALAALFEAEWNRKSPALLQDMR